MILITDVGRDIDDALAITYAMVSGVPYDTIVTTCKDSAEASNICHNIISNLSDQYPKIKDIEIYTGSTKPKKGGLNHGATYHGEFSKSNKTFPKFDSSKIEKADVTCIGPLTDLVQLIKNEKVKRVMFRGQPIKDGETLTADMDSYNFKCDPWASEATFQFQDKLSFGFIGKTLAYKVPFSEADFDAIAKVKHPVAQFLVDHAHTTFEQFKKNVPELYERIYKGTGNMAYAYDPLTVLAIKQPGLFTFEKVGRHRIGTHVDAEKAKSALLDGIIKGLSGGNLS